MTDSNESGKGAPWFADVLSALVSAGNTDPSILDWPVPQTRYDDIGEQLVDLIELKYLRGIADGELRVPLALRASNILREFDALVACLINFSWSREHGRPLIYSPDSRMHRMVDNDEFDDRFRISQNPEMFTDRPTVGGIRGHARVLVSHLKAKANQTLGFTDTYTIAPNMLASQLTPPSHIRLLPGLPRSVFKMRRNTTVPNHVTDFGDDIVREVREILLNSELEMTPAAHEYLRSVVGYYLATAWSDVTYPVDLSIRFQNSHLLTGTGGSYVFRYYSYRFQAQERPVVRFAHGGDPQLFEDLAIGEHEMAYADLYVAHGAGEAEVMNRRISDDRFRITTGKKPVIVGIGSEYHRRIAVGAGNRASTQRRPERVAIVTAAFLNERRPPPLYKLQDVHYLNWYARLTSQLQSSGFEVIVKRHPKARLAGVKLFHSDVRELLGVPFEPTAIGADAFIFDFAGSAFMEALCTDRPIVLVDLPVRRFNADTLADLGQACEIVHAEFDDQNRVVVDSVELIEAINAPVKIDFRRQFVDHFLLKPSPDLSALDQVVRN